MKRLLQKLYKEEGMTLAETLMAVLIMSIIFTAVGGGVVVMKNNHEKVTWKAEAQVLIAATISAINMDLEAATRVTMGESNDQVKCFFSSRRNLLMTFVDTNDNTGIALASTNDQGTAGATASLLMKRTMSKTLHTKFKSDENPLKYVISDGEQPHFEYTIQVVKDSNSDTVMEEMTVMVSPISPVEVNAIQENPPSSS